MEGINSKSCIQALQIRIKEIIQQEIEIMFNRLGSKYWKKPKYSKYLKNEPTQVKTGEPLNGI